jgi:hypothetical protein
MSQKQIFHHNNKKPTPPDGGWTPAYTKLSNRFFSYLVSAIKEGRISPSDEPAEVYNKTPFLWSINPYKFSCFFRKSSAASAGASMSTLLSDDKESTILLSRLSLGALQNNLSQSSLPSDTILRKSCEQPPESKHMFSQSHPTIPRSAVPMHGTQFNASGRPVDGTPMAWISSFRQAHQ